MTLPSLHVFIQGACIYQGTKEARACASTCWPRREFEDKCFYLSSESMRQKHRALFTAAIRSIEQAYSIDPSEKRTLKIYTNSKYLSNVIYSWMCKWKEDNWTLKNGSPPMNLDLIKTLDMVCKNRKVECLLRSGCDHAENTITWMRRATDVAREGLSSDDISCAKVEESVSPMPLDKDNPFGSETVIQTFVQGVCDNHGTKDARACASTCWPYLELDDTCFYLDPHSVRSSHRALFTAVIKAAEQADSFDPERTKSLEIITNSKFLYSVMELWSTNWKRRGWVRNGGGNIKNIDLIKKVYDIGETRATECLYRAGSTHTPYTSAWMRRASRIARKGMISDDISLAQVEQVVSNEVSDGGDKSNKRTKWGISSLRMFHP